jgi:hypothetical protein
MERVLEHLFFYDVTRFRVAWAFLSGTYRAIVMSTWPISYVSTSSMIHIVE